MEPFPAPGSEWNARLRRAEPKPAVELPAFAELLPPLSDGQLSLLESDILKNGCFIIRIFLFPTIFWPRSPKGVRRNIHTADSLHHSIVTVYCRLTKPLQDIPPYSNRSIK